MERDLLARDFLYEHPEAYREGVEAAFQALRAHPLVGRGRAGRDHSTTQTDSRPFASGE